MGQLPVMVVALFLYLENALECEISKKCKRFNAFIVLYM